MKLGATEARLKSGTQVLSRRRTKFKRSDEFSIMHWYYELLFAGSVCLNVSLVFLRRNTGDSPAAVLLLFNDVSITLTQNKRTGSPQPWWGRTQCTWNSHPLLMEVQIDINVLEKCLATFTKWKKNLPILSTKDPTCTFYLRKSEIICSCKDFYMNTLYPNSNQNLVAEFTCAMSQVDSPVWIPPTQMGALFGKVVWPSGVE